MIRRVSRVRVEPMFETMMARMLLRVGYRSRSLSTNERQFRDAAAAIERAAAEAAALAP